MFLLVVAFLLITVGGIFTASETGLVTVERIKILSAKHEKQTWAVYASHFLKKPERFFSTILVCENLILVIASTLGAKFFIDLVGGRGVWLSTIVLSLYSLVIGQYLPKTIALAYPYQTVSALSTVIYSIEIVTYPIVSVFAKLSKGLANLFRRGEVSEQIRRLDIIHAMGEYEEKASRLAARLFNFSKRIAIDIMIPLEAAFLCEKGNELAVFSKHHRRLYTRIPVYAGDRENIIGVFNIKDYFYQGKVILRKPFFVDSQERCMAVFSAMKQKGEHMAIVRNSEKNIIGIMTLEDLIEELVGEIRDEW